jgi:hypothetical protein
MTTLQTSSEIEDLCRNLNPAIWGIARYFTKGEHLKGELLKQISIMYHDMAVQLLSLHSLEGPQLTVALNRLMESKDAAVRAAL